MREDREVYTPVDVRLSDDLIVFRLDELKEEKAFSDIVVLVRLR